MVPDKEAYHWEERSRRCRCCCRCLRIFASVAVLNIDLNLVCHVVVVVVRVGSPRRGAIVSRAGSEPRTFAYASRCRTLRSPLM
jgi:hypothetical protein